jgi:type IV pilus assembly protein PilC
MKVLLFLNTDVKTIKMWRVWQQMVYELYTYIMTRFSYTAQKGEEQAYHGSADVKDRFELYTLIRREGGKILSITESSDNSIWSLRYWNARLTSISEQTKITFAHTLSSMLKAGLPLSRALMVIERQTTNPRFIDVVSEVEGDVRHGSSFHEALTRFPNVFSPLFIAMIKSGEEGGTLSDALKTIADQMERMHTLKKKVRGALIYPAIIVIAIVGIGAIMMIEVVPTLAQTFTELNVDLPVSTQIIIGVSNFLVAHTLVALIIILSVFIAITMAARTSLGKRFFDWALLHTPLVGGIVRELNSARTARTIASLLSSGVAMLTALSVTREVVQNSFFREVLHDAEADVQRGEALSKAFALREDLYPPLVSEMIAVGEETGDLAGMLENTAVYYEEEVSRKTKDMSTIIEPFLMVIIGIVVGFFALSMIAPIYQLSDAI